MVNNNESADYFKLSISGSNLDERLIKQIEFLIEVDKMKNVLRQTVLTDKSRRENDAEHSWHLALMAVVLYEYSDNPGIDLHRVIKMVLTHDLVEIYAGDTFAYDEAGQAGKPERERRAADKLFAMLPVDQGTELRALWVEFDEMVTPDAVFASAIDRLQPLLINYVAEGYTWKTHEGVTCDKILKRMGIVKNASPVLWNLVETLLEDSIKKGYLKDNR